MFTIFQFPFPRLNIPLIHKANFFYERNRAINTIKSHKSLLNSIKISRVNLLIFIFFTKVNNYKILDRVNQSWVKITNRPSNNWALSFMSTCRPASILRITEFLTMKSFLEASIYNYFSQLAGE